MGGPIRSDPMNAQGPGIPIAGLPCVDTIDGALLRLYGRRGRPESLSSSLSFVAHSAVGRRRGPRCPTPMSQL